MKTIVDFICKESFKNDYAVEDNIKYIVFSDSVAVGKDVDNFEFIKCFKSYNDLKANMKKFNISKNELNHIAELKEMSVMKIDTDAENNMYGRVLWCVRIK